MGDNTVLEQVQRHVREGDAHIARQKKIIAQLAEHDLDTSAAQELLAIFEMTQASHVEHLERLL